MGFFAFFLSLRKKKNCKRCNGKRCVCTDMSRHERRIFFLLPVVFVYNAVECTMNILIVIKLCTESLYTTKSSMESEKDRIVHMWVVRISIKMKRAFFPRVIRECARTIFFACFGLLFRTQNQHFFIFFFGCPLYVGCGAFISQFIEKKNTVEIAEKKVCSF